MNTYSYLFIIGTVGLLSACANPFAPTGGPKDTTPPQAIVAPKDTLINYAGEPLVWAFDENIQRPKAENIVISPQADFEVEHRGRSLILTPKGMKDSVVYHVGLKDVVRDFNEGNSYPEQNLRITSMDSLAHQSLHYSMDVIPQNIDEEELVAEIFCAERGLTYALKGKDRFNGTIEHIHSNWSYLYRIYRDPNKNNVLDSGENYWSDTLSVGSTNGMLIEGLPSTAFTVDSLSDTWSSIYPKPGPTAWEKIRTQRGYIFSTYAWGDDTVYASSQNGPSLISKEHFDSNSKLLSYRGSFSSDSICAIWLDSDTTTKSKHISYRCYSKDYSIYGQDSNTIKPLHRGMYHFSFVLDTTQGPYSDSQKVIRFYGENGDLLFVGSYKNESLYSLYTAPFFVQVSRLEDSWAYYASDLQATENFLLHTTLHKRKKININD